MLPPRSQADEDAFIEALQGASLDELVAAVVEAIEDGRPGLAARAVGLITEELPDHPAIARAQRASRMLLMAAPDRRGPIIEELESAVADLKRQFVNRAVARQRRRAKGNEPAPRRKPRSTRGR